MSHTKRLARARRKAGAGECTLPSEPHSHIFRGARMVCVPYVLRTGSMEWNTEEATRLINAIGHDAGNASMRKAGRTVWARADYNAACRESNRLFKAVGLAR